MNKLKENQLLLLLLAMALIIRLYAAFQTPVIAKDGTVYMQNALSISSGEFSKGLEGYPPVYPALVAIFYKMMGDVDLAGQAVSVILGTLALLPFYGLVKEIFGRQITSVASVFFVFQPFLVQHSGEAISESTYIFFFLSALYMAWRALQDGRLIFYVWFGLSASLAYLTRPEGFGILFGFIVWLPIHARISKRRRFALHQAPEVSAEATSSPSCRSFDGKVCFVSYGPVVLAIISFTVLAAPYLLHVRETTGEWRLNAKRNMMIDSGLHKAIKIKSDPVPVSPAAKPVSPDDPKTAHSNQTVLQPPPPFPGFVEPKDFSEFAVRFVKTLVLSIVKFTGILHVALLIFLVLFLIQRKAFSYHLEGELFLVFFFILYLLAMALLYVSGRHLLQLVPLSLPWAAAGLLGLSRRFAGLKVKSFFLGPSALLIILTIGILLPKTLASHRADKLPLKEAAFWIKFQKISSPAILSTDSRVAYYAKGRHIQFARQEEIVPIAQEEKPDFVVIEKDEIQEISPDTLLALRPMILKEVFHAKNDDGSLIVTVYTLVPT